jgi:hypothetical protein
MKKYKGITNVPKIPADISMTTFNRGKSPISR